MIKKNIYIVPSLIAFFSLVVIGIALQLDTSPEMIVGDSMQARSFPIFLMILNLILLSVLTFQLHNGKGVLPQEFPMSLSYKGTNLILTIKNFPTWGSMILFGLFYFLTVYTDMFIAIFLVMFLMCRLWGEKRLWVCILTASITPGLIFLLFDFVLKIRFPRGLLMNIYYG